ncbi:5'-nucleotidase [Aliarcobacter cryaerophilus]|uniref:5'-nucleotidase n=1 Tax=Aliarcobacter cryaerophilus TaxID=28198 RepID=UPI0021B560B0|nr:5'-nucleotidase [Aliarcobacter cryaerophilus]MCT7471553.1 5'-nucleotidase [Aliarcobacter cryaerophilus]
MLYKNNGLDAFIEYEKLNKDNPLEMGPFAKLLLTIAKIQVAYAGTIRTASRFTSGHSAEVDSDS